MSNTTREKNALWAREKREEFRGKIFSLFDGKCVRCGFSDILALQIDHVHSDGHLDSRAGNFYRKVFNSIVNGEKRYQVLCANCNQIKKVEKSEHAQRKYSGTYKGFPPDNWKE